MPFINRYGCSECDFQLPSGWGGYTYAVDNEGKRVICPHPGEDRRITEVTGLSYSDAQSANRVGHAQYCVCLECLKQFDLDLERDNIDCPACSSAQVRSARQMIGMKCPRCKVGIIEEGSLVRWKLDPDWEQLPVAQIVKDLMKFANEGKVPPELQEAADIADALGDFTFETIVGRLLAWWEGDYFSNDREQKDSAEMRQQWTWCKALPAVLRGTPALADLVIIGDSCCMFAQGVSPELRRGIKNYIRKHRIHIVMS